MCSSAPHWCLCFFFFFNDTATTEIYTLSLHDALPISRRATRSPAHAPVTEIVFSPARRSEEHTSELQSHSHLVCRLLLEKKVKRDAVGVRGDRAEAAAEEVARLQRAHPRCDCGFGYLFF